MKLFIVDSDYKEVVDKIENNKKFKLAKDFEHKQNVYAENDFGNIWSHNHYFKEHGFTTFCTIMNAKNLQIKWFEENSKNLEKNWLSKISRNVNTTQILIDQIKYFKPDYILVKDIKMFSQKHIEIAKLYSKRLVGEIASSLPSSDILTQYDLIFSAHPDIVNYLRSKGIPSKYVPLGFDSRFTEKYKTNYDRDIDICFVGSDGLSWNSYELFKSISETGLNFRIYGNFQKRKLVSLGISKHFCGSAYGKEMYKIYARSKIILNRLGTNTGNFSVNMRMYEATGMGGLLLTEYKPNLKELFDESNDISTYKSPSEAALKSKYLIDNESELKRIAENGQRRTLMHHTYEKRVKLMVDFIQN